MVPQVLSTADRYALVKKLWFGFKSRETINVTFHPDSCNDKLVEILTKKILRRATVRIPQSLEDTLAWLYDEDSVAIQNSLEALEKEDSMITANALLSHIDDIKSAGRKADGLNFNSIVNVTLPFANITIKVTNEITNTEKINIMNEDDQEDLAKNPITIHNPSDLLGEALQRLPKKKAEELLGKAAEEALRIQVKRTETQLDRDEFKANVNDAVVSAQRVADEKNIRLDIKGTSKNPSIFGNFC